MSTKEVEITKEEYSNDSPDWEERLIKKYGLNAAEIADSQRNFNGKKYTYDIWLREIWIAEDEAVYAPLRRKKLRVEARARRDKNRVRKFSHKRPRTKQAAGAKKP